MALGRVGLLKTTLADFPGEVAATVFTPGCNLRCGFCHNPEFISPPYAYGLLSLEEVKRYLEKRANLLGGVCITGGEPLLHEDLYDFVFFIKKLGLKVKLDTNGTFPDRIDTGAVDYLAMDVKTVPAKYGLLGGPIVYEREGGRVRLQLPLGGDTEKQASARQERTDRLAREVIASVRKIIAAGVSAGGTSASESRGFQYEFRTTLVPGIVGTEEIRELCGVLKGARLWVLASFNPKKTLDPKLADILPYNMEKTRELASIIREAGIPVKVRGGE